MGRQDGPNCAVNFLLPVCTPCELPNAAATASSLSPQSNELQATGVTCAYSHRTLMVALLLVCAGMECHKVVKLLSYTAASTVVLNALLVITLPGSNSGVGYVYNIYPTLCVS
jgi:hypothetical protein